LEGVLRDVQHAWRLKGWGIQTGEALHSILCNLRFADDILLLATSKEQLHTMLTDLANAAKRVGLEMHMGKTKVLSNVEDEDREGTSYINIGGSQVEILPLMGSSMYLGRLLCLGALHDEEVRHRIRRGWAKFHQFKKELCGRNFPLVHRLRLFEAVVTPSVLYGCGTWTMNKDRERSLRTAQRQMMRTMVKVGRRTFTKTEDAAADMYSETSDEDACGRRGGRDHRELG
jgi:hypothetical protein